MMSRIELHRAHRTDASDIDGVDEFGNMHGSAHRS
jgi:hypothetical protein